MPWRTLTTVLVGIAVLVTAVGLAATSGSFDPDGKRPTKGYVAVQTYRWLRDNAPDAIEGCDRKTDQYDDLDQESVSDFKREAINCLASVGFFNDWPGLAVTTTSSTISASTTSTATVPRLSDAQIRQILIDESIASYSGSCACPYNRARNGSRCGGRSAWSRAGGASPLCYTSDVTQEMIDRYRRQHGS